MIANDLMGKTTPSKHDTIGKVKIIHYTCPLYHIRRVYMWLAALQGTNTQQWMPFNPVFYIIKSAPSIVLILTGFIFFSFVINALSFKTVENTFMEMTRLFDIIFRYD